MPSIFSAKLFPKTLSKIPTKSLLFSPWTMPLEEKNTQNMS